MRRMPVVQDRVSATEDRLRDLMVRGLGGDNAAYHSLLQELSAHLRAFLRKRLARLPDGVEHLVQETLLAVYNQRHTMAAPFLALRYLPGMLIPTAAGAAIGPRLLRW